MGVAEPRILTNQHVQQKAGTLPAARKNRSALDPLNKNEMKLYSYFKPSLKAGRYVIKARQEVQVKDDATHYQIYNGMEMPHDQVPVVEPKQEQIKGQEFKVIAPQFSIDTAVINSFYPPEGHQDEARILPHICFNDPHLPWERDAGMTIKDKEDLRNVVPWMALVVFDPEELRLGSFDEVQALNIKGITATDFPTKQNVYGNFEMKVQDFMQLKSRVRYEAGFTTDAVNLNDSKADLSKVKWRYTDAKDDWQDLMSDSSLTHSIFPTKKLFSEIFANRGDDPSIPLTNASGHNIKSFKYLSHIRHVNTVGCPGAGIEQEGLFSIVLSCRTGNIKITEPRTQICHLVSLEHIDTTYQSIFDAVEADSKVGDERIGMVSLYSWIYTGLPPNPVNFVDTIREVVAGRQVIRPPQPTLDNLQNLASNTTNVKQAAAAKALSTRFNLGFTIARWRAETGEETSAFSRGPLVPQPVPWFGTVKDPNAKGFGLNYLPGSSNTGKEYQIVDSSTGLADLSYSSAWTLGKILAISDTTFNTALMRFRGLVYNRAADRARKMKANMKSEAQVLRELSRKSGAIRAMSSGRTGDPNRVPTHDDTKDPPPSLDSEDMMKLFRIALDRGVGYQASAGDEIYNDAGLNLPNNSDWPVIHNWILDKLYLSGIPAHYLIPDPSFLPKESLRFFCIDDNWMDCLVDGALSVANHLDQQDDLIRFEIKAALNKYFRTPVAGIRPQVPTCGFILRSQVVKVMPDMRIEVKWTTPDPVEAERHKVCRYINLDSETILALFDRPLEELQSIKLQQPPHQQRFSLGYRLENGILKFQFRYLYTVDPGKNEDGSLKNWDPFLNEQQPTLAQTKLWYHEGSRCINTTKFATDTNTLCNKFQASTNTYKDPTPNSCELGMQLNDPAYFFELRPEKPQPKQSTPTVRIRELRNIVPTVKSLTPTSTPPTPPLPPSDPPASTPIKPIPSGFPGPGSSSNITPSLSTLFTPVATLDKQLLADRITPNFQLQVYPDYKLPLSATALDERKRLALVDADEYIPTRNNYLPDIIFSVRKLGASRSANLALKEITISIPIVSDTNKPRTNANDPIPLFKNDYDGPGALMLGTQRFIPLLNKTATSLDIRLIPRSASRKPFIVIDTPRTEDLTFKLAQPQIAEWPTGNPGVRTAVTIKGADGKREIRGVSVVVMYERYARAGEVDGKEWVTRTEWKVYTKEATDDDDVGRPTFERKP